MITRRALVATLAALPAAAAPSARAGEPPAASLLAEVNRMRAAHRLRALQADSALSRAAQAHAHDLARRGTLDHTGSDGRSLGDRLLAVGYSWHVAAENLAQDGSDPAKVVTLWMESPGHRRNLLLDDVRDGGVGIAASGTDFVWVLDLAAR